MQREKQMGQTYMRLVDKVKSACFGWDLLCGGCIFTAAAHFVNWWFFLK
jgi:hypothetical protein